MYVSINEFKQSPTGIDVSKLDQTNRSSSAAQDAMLTQVLRRASAWVDSICKQTLKASSTVETKEVHLTRDGRIVVHPDNVPLISVSNVQYRLFPSYNYTNVDNMQIQTYQSWFTIYGLTFGYITPNLIFRDPSFGYYSPYRMQQLDNLPVTLQYTYTHGYASTELSVAATNGDSTITVPDAIGMSSGMSFTIYDGANTEYCTVDSVAGNALTLKSPLVFDHVVKTPVTAVPEDVRQATILLAGILIRERGSVAVTMNETTIGNANSTYVKMDDLDVAKSLLAPYMRVVTS